MCTAALTPGPDEGLAMVFNRDELKTRSRAVPPRVRDTDAGVRMIAPSDPDGGGTWIGVTELGLIFALLNHYEAAKAFSPSEPVRSRGHVIPALAGCADLDAVSDALLGLRPGLAHVRPFELLAAEPASPGPRAVSARWDGERLEIAPRELPVILVSSSRDTSRAREHRLAALAPLSEGAGVTVADLQALMRGHTPEPGPWSACMHRADAATVSQAVVLVARSRVEMTYLDGPPCESPIAQRVSLPRIAAGSR